MGNRLFVKLKHQLPAHFSLLSHVRLNPELTKSGPYLNEVVEKYIKFMQEFTNGIPDWPGNDVMWIWYLHRLQPLAYYQDCISCFYRVIDDHDLKATKRDLSKVSNNKFKPSIDLTNEAILQRHFMDKLMENNYDHMELDEPKINMLIDDYYKFLKLVTKMDEYKFHLVPTIGIDLIWHTHLMMPNDYRNDVKKLCGFVYDHCNDVVHKPASYDLNYGYTQMLWRIEYHTVYSELKDKINDNGVYRQISN